MRIRNLILILVAVAVVSGCQANLKADTTKQAPIIDHGIPQSTGPTDTPSVKGPTSAPPEDATSKTSDLSPQAEAVTTNENIRLTLPLQTDTK